MGYYPQVPGGIAQEARSTRSFKEQIKAGTPKDQILAKVKTDDIGWNVNTAQWQAPARLDPLYDEFSKAN